MIQNGIIHLLCVYTRVSKSFLEKSCNSLLMRYAVRAIHYTMQQDEPNRIIWIDKCLREFQLQLPFPTLPNLMGAVVLSLCYFKNGLFKVGLPYFSYVVRIAKELGINREAGLALLTSDPNEKEDCRNIWWLLYRIDQFLWSFNKGNITNDDNGVYLPETALNINTLDNVKSLGMELMSSNCIFTPNVPIHSVAVHRVLLCRLFGQAVKFSEMSNNDQSIDTLFMLYNLKDSLQLWNNNLPDSFTLQYQLLDNDLPIDPVFTWQILDSYLIYNFAMILIKSAIIFPHILENYNEAVQESIFPSLLQNCKELARIISFNILKSPSLDKTTIYFINYIYYGAVPLIIAPSIEFDGIVPTFLGHIQALVRKFKVGNPIIGLIHSYLDVKDPRVIIERHKKYKFIDYLTENDDLNDQYAMQYLRDDL
ncbi:hypothetical protein HDV06_001982 [Boothiomyces sp. JEL0866]|nr:hypothetical protein HDV06_001982 [Boothiomyces sp. JEL0866]